MKRHHPITLAAILLIALSLSSVLSAWAYREYTDARLKVWMEKRIQRQDLCAPVEENTGKTKDSAYRNLAL
jgi:hypothetical protein